MTVTKPENDDCSSELSCDIWDDEGKICNCCEYFLTKDFKDDILFGHEGTKYKYGDRCYACNLLHNCKLCGQLTKMSDFCHNCEKRGNKNREFFFCRDHRDKSILRMCYEDGEIYEIKNINQ